MEPVALSVLGTIPRHSAGPLTVVIVDPGLFRPTETNIQCNTGKVCVIGRERDNLRLDVITHKHHESGLVMELPGFR